MGSKISKEAKYQAPALEKGLAILEYLSGRGEAASQKEIADAMERSPNEIYRMLMCLDEKGYIRKDPGTGLYGLTLKLYSLSHGASPVERLREAALPILKKLSLQANQSSHITVFYEDSLMILAPTTSPGPISVVMEEGRTYPLLATTSGRALLAQCSEKERLNRLKRLKEYNALPPGEQEELESSLRDLNRKGCLVRKSQLTQGITDIAVIIGTDAAPLRASLSLCCLNTELGRNLSIQEMTQALKDAASSIARTLGCDERTYP